MEQEPERIDLNKALEQSGWLRALAIHLVGPDRADDLVQDAWVRTLERPPRKPDSMRPWLARVITHLSLDSMRSEGRRKRREQAVASPQVSAVPEEAVAFLEVQEQVMQAVQALRDPYRTIIILRYYQGLAIKQIAERLAISPSTASNRLARGLQALRQNLEARHGREWRETSLALLLPASSPLIPPVATASGLEILIMTMKSKLMVAAVALAVISGVLIWPDDSGLKKGIVQKDLGASAQNSESLVDDVKPGTLDPADAKAQVAQVRVPLEGAKVGVTLRVVDESGIAIPNARVRVFESDRRDLSFASISLDYFFPDLRPEQSALSGEDGLAFLEGLQRGKLWAFFAEANGFAARLRVDELEQGPDLIELGDFVLEQGYFLTLQLVDPEGNPVPGAKVYSMGDPPRLAGTLRAQVEFTNEEGLVEFRSLAEGTQGIRTDPPGFLYYQETDIELAHEPIPPRRVVLGRGGSIDLTVLEADGTPAEGVEVYSEIGGFNTPLVRLEPHLSSFQGRTGGNGRFLVQGLQEERASHGIAIRRGQAWAASESLVAGERLTLRLPSSHAIQGRILQLDGSPAEGATLLLVNENDPALPPDFQTELDEDGVFQTELPAGSYRLSCWHESGGLIHPPTIVLYQALDLGDLELTVSSSLILRIEDQDGTTLPEASVRFPPPHWLGLRMSYFEPEDLQAVLLFNANRFFPNTPDQWSEESGVWRITHLSPGRYTLQIYAEGFNLEEFDVEILQDQVVEQTIQLEATAELVLEVVDEAGEPVRGASIGLVPDGYDRYWNMKEGTSSPKFLPTNQRTDPEGIVRFRSIGIGRWHIGRWGRTQSGFFWSTLEIQPGINRHQIQIPTQSTVDFLITGPQGPVEGAHIDVQRKLGQPHSLYPGMEFESGGFSGNSDSEGRWILDEMEEATYRIRVFPPGAFPLEKEIRVHSGATHFQFQLEGGAVSGRVVNPAKGTHVYLANFLKEPDQAANYIRRTFWDSESGGRIAIGSNLRFGTMVPDQEGNFAFLGIPPGTYFLVARAPNHVATVAQRVEVTGNPIENLNLTLEPAGSLLLQVSGMAEFRRKHPSAKIRMQAISLSGKRITSRPIFIREDGEIPFAPLEPGAAEISISFHAGVPNIPRILLQATVTDGQATTVQWDASSL